jgi:hypothetical protein
MRSTRVEIYGGLTRRRNQITLSGVARNYPSSIEWIRAIEGREILSARVARRYCRGLRRAIEHRRAALMATLTGLASPQGSDDLRSREQSDIENLKILRIPKNGRRS